MNPFETLAQIIADADGITADLQSEAGNNPALSSTQSEAHKDAAALVEMARERLAEAYDLLCEALGDPDATEPSFTDGEA